MTIRAKFKCSTRNVSTDGSYINIQMTPVISDTPENETWSKYTPGGLLEMCISNANAFSQFELGKEYYLDINPAS